MAKLDEAIASFEKGLLASDQPPNADVGPRAHFGLGRTYFLKSWLGKANLWAESEAEFDLVIDAHREGDLRLQELAAQSYGQLGLVKYRVGDDDGAIFAFEQALELSSYDRYKTEYAKWLSRIYAEQGNEKKASDYAELASQYQH